MGRLHRAVTAVGAVVVIGVRLRSARTRTNPSPARRADRSPPARQHHRHRHRRPRRPARGRGGLGTRRDDGDDGQRWARLFRPRRAAHGRIRRPGPLEWLCRIVRETASSVGAASPAVHAFQLRKLDAAVGTTGVVPGRRPPDHGGGIRAPWIDPDATSPTRPPQTDSERSSAHRNGLAASPHQAQHSEGRHRLRHVRRRPTTATTARLRPGSALWRAVDSDRDSRHQSVRRHAALGRGQPADDRRLCPWRPVLGRHGAARRRLPLDRPADGWRRLDDAGGDE